MYTKYLQTVAAQIEYCDYLRHVPKTVAKLKPHVIILNPMEDLLLGIDVLIRAQRHHPSTRIITIGHTIPDKYINHFMKIGVSYHINRSFTQPRDLAMAVEELLKL